MEHTPTSCIFCRIIAGEIPAHRIYEDSDYIAFLDINPRAPGHTLLVPKQAPVWLQEISDEVIAETFIKAKFLMIKIKQALDCDYVQLGVVGKDVPHVHIHLIPQYFDERTSPRKYKPGEAESIVEKIKSFL